MTEKPEISILVAYDESRLIGDSQSNDLPWHIPEDLKRFKKLTTGNVIIMGRKTWESLPVRPLPNRWNIVVSSTLTKDLIDSTKTFVVPTIQDAIEMDFPDWTKTKFIIGGAQIYKSALDSGLVDKIIASEVHGKHKGDIYFPELDDSWDQGSLKEECGDFNVVEYVRS